ncbi:MAG: NAD(P)-dependent oxidoreductase [Bryobacteraceae bacterium]|nr:NAD(P)-dependent oxidoreductase [Bryobacteraceae bacterium]MDW8379108.1 NAD(P)-dependent oxidoreductase [Bryobacterales bacterium]
MLVTLMPYPEQLAVISIASKQISVVGLGLMGTALSARLLEHGWQVAVWNRTVAKAEPVLAKGARWTDRPFAADLVLISLYTSEIVEQVLQQHKADLHVGQVLIDTTTAEPEHSADLGRRLAARHIAYLDAPISGSSEQARQGEATLIVGGDRAVFDLCAELWGVLAARVFYSGACGSAARMKLISNLVLGLNRAALAEGLAFAEALGVEPSSALEILRGSMAYSRTMDVKGRKMIDRNYEPQARLSQHLKDVRLMQEAARQAGVELPLTATHQKLLEQAEAQGYGALDNSAIFEVLRRRPE